MSTNAKCPTSVSMRPWANHPSYIGRRSDDIAFSSSPTQRCTADFLTGSGHLLAARQSPQCRNVRTRKTRGIRQFIGLSQALAGSCFRAVISAAASESPGLWSAVPRSSTRCAKINLPGSGLPACCNLRSAAALHRFESHRQNSQPVIAELAVRTSHQWRSKIARLPQRGGLRSVHGLHRQPQTVSGSARMARAMRRLRLSIR